MKPLLCLTTVALILAPAALPAAEPKGDPVLDALRKEPGLQSKEAVAARDQPLGDFLDGLAKSTHVILHASRDTEDDRVTVFTKGRPLAETLIQFARHYDFQWRKYKTGFELWQDLPARQRQAAARLAIRRAQLVAIQERMARVASLIGQPADRVAAQRADLMQRLGMRQLPADDRTRIQEQLIDLNLAARPAAAAGLALYRQLGAPHFSALLAGSEVRFSTRDGSLPAGVAAQVHDAARSAQASMRTLRVEVDSRGGGGSPQIAPAPNDGAPPTGASASVKLDSGPSGLFAGLGRKVNQPLSLHLVLSSIRGGPNDQRVIPVTWSIPAPTVRPASPPGSAGDPDLDQEIELFPRVAPGAPAPGAPAGSAPPVIRYDPRNLPSGQVLLSRIAEKLHEKAGLDLLSDSFIRCRLPQGPFAGKHKVSYFLEQVARNLDYAWGKQGKLVSLRDNAYFDDRPAEIPQRLSLAWRDRLERAGGFGLDDLGEMAATLTDPQVLNLQNYWAWYLEGGKVDAPEAPANLYSVREHLRFWSVLTTQQKRGARGEIIATRLMNSGQKNAFVKALVSSDGFSFREAVAQSPPSAAALGAGGFHLEVGTGQMREFRGQTGEGGQVVIRSVDIGTPEPGAPPKPAPTPRLPNGEDVKLGAPVTTTLDTYSFRYHLAGNPQPARTVTIQMARPTPRNGEKAD